MTTSAVDIKTVLTSSSPLALTFGTNIFVGLMPDSPDACVSVLDSPGLPPDPNGYYLPYVHILVRGGQGEYLSTSDRAAAIMAAVHEYKGTPTGASYYYTGVWATSEPFFIGTDDNLRPLFSINLRIQRR